MLKRTSRTLLALISCLLLGGAFIQQRATTAAVNAPLTAPGLLGSEFQISSGLLPGDPERAAVSYNSKRSEYLVVWRTSSSALYGQRVSSMGMLVDVAFVVTVNGRQPAAAYNANNDQYLVVWSEDGVSGRIDVYGRRLAWDGATLGDPFVIWSWPNRRLTRPRVAWNSSRNEYFVVWGASDSTTFLATDIAGLEVSAAGIPGLVAHIIQWNNQPIAPDITFNSGTDPYSIWSNVYYVVWRERDPVNNSYAIMGAVGRDAGATWGSYEYLSDRRAVIDYGEPAVASNQFYFFAAWRKLDLLSYSAQIESRVINLYGVTNTVVLPISPQMEVLYSGSPSVAAVTGVNRKFLVTWTMPTIVGRSILASQCADGVAVAVECQLTMVRSETIGPYSYVAQPTTAAGGPNYLLAYGANISSQLIYGRILWMARQFLPLIQR